MRTFVRTSLVAAALLLGACSNARATDAAVDHAVQDVAQGMDAFDAAMDATADVASREVVDADAVAEVVSSDLVVAEGSTDVANEPDVTDVVDATIAEGGVCTFPSGRPCTIGEGCTDWCNWCECASADGGVICTAADCGPATDVPNEGTGALDCDPSHVTCGLSFAICGPNEIHSVVDGCWGDCVFVADCAPIPCDPAYSDACPKHFVCDAGTRTCVFR